MKKFGMSLALFVVCILFSSDVFAYNTCNPNNICVPCTYSGVNYDTVMRGGSTVAFYKAASYTVYHIPNNTYWYILNNNGSHCDGKVWLGNYLFGCFGNTQINPTASNFLWQGEGVLYQLTVTREPEAGGGVETGDDRIQCGVDGLNNCHTTYNVPTTVSLQAYPNCNYEFLRFEWNNGANNSTDNPLSLNVDAKIGVEAVFNFNPGLGWPLSGTPESRTIISKFKDDWLTYCDGLIKKHMGIDISASANETVTAAEAGEIKLIFEDTSDYQWGWCIVIEHNSSYTTTYWHLNDPRNAQIYTGATITKGQSIGTIKNMPDNTHLHFGVRNHAYTADNIPNAGALPQTDNCDGYPVYPEFFVDPEDLT